MYYIFIDSRNLPHADTHCSCESRWCTGSERESRTRRSAWWWSCRSSAAPASFFTYFMFFLIISFVPWWWLSYSQPRLRPHSAPPPSQRRYCRQREPSHLGKYYYCQSQILRPRLKNYIILHPAMTSGPALAPPPIPKAASTLIPSEKEKSASISCSL